MPDNALLLGAALQVVTALVYFHVGRVTSMRRIGGEAQLAARLFSVWWFTLGALTAVGAFTRLLVLAGVLDLGLHATLSHLNLLSLCVALWALLYYLVYLFTGSRRWFLPITAFYIVFYVGVVYLLTAAEPVGVIVERGVVRIDYARELSGGPLVALVLALILPPVLGAIGYARLFFQVEELTQRYRIGLVAFTILAWFGSSLVAWAGGFSQAGWWRNISQFFGLIAALAILAAFRPPGFIQRRWGIHAVDEPST